MKYLMKPLFLIVALLSVWSSQAMASLSEADVRGVIDVRNELAERRHELIQLVPELQARVDREIEAMKARERAFEEAMMSGDDAVQSDAIKDRVNELVQRIQGAQAKSFEERYEEQWSVLKNSEAGSEFVEDIVERHGFSDLDDYFAADLRVLKVTTVISTEQMQAASGPAITPEMRDSPYFTEEQVAETQAWMDAQQEAFDKQFADVTDAEKRAVAPFMNELVTFSEDDDEYSDY